MYPATSIPQRCDRSDRGWSAEVSVANDMVPPRRINSRRRRRRTAPVFDIVVQRLRGRNFSSSYAAALFGGYASVFVRTTLRPGTSGQLHLQRPFTGENRWAVVWPTYSKSTDRDEQTCLGVEPAIRQSVQAASRHSGNQRHAVFAIQSSISR